MSVQLGSIIEKIKQEGVEEGRLISQQMIVEATARADRIVEEARQEASRLLEDAQKKSRALEKSGEIAVQQAARDALLQLKGQIQTLFDRVFKRKVSDALTPETVRDIIMRLVDKWTAGANVEITLNDGDFKKVESLLFSGLREDLKNGLMLGTSPDIERGFRIGVQGEGVRYDFTDESISQTVRQYMKPRIREILEKGDG
jgi:V/A-type H+/Na+-transporting ATPase subunit E